ncbi:MAG TPA: rhomboid family intramembrane serine protease [Methylomirabilota bacterium]|jgi:membrane associated rhomboid family serine protease|nr:rhomboid family intramembrane serine protease [Methylomirabilota bacterium]
MIPLKDDVPSRSTPIITILLIALNVAAYVYQLSLGLTAEAPGRAASEALVLEFGATPCRLTGLCDRGDFPSPYVTIFTSMFLHGSPLHIAGNMLYLWIFGDNVEDALGHARFLLFYLLAGVGAAVAQTITAPASVIPMIGASGAISGVLGAYLLLFPYATVLTLVVFGFFIRTVHIPAVVVLGFWIVLQLVNGWLTVSASMMGRGEIGGVAWFAHIGGFLAGMVLLLLFRPRTSRRP